MTTPASGPPTDVASRRAFCTLVAAAFIDGKFDNKEKSVIFRKARDMKLPVQTVDEIIELGRGGKLAVSIPPTRQGKEELLNDLIDVACADGRLDPPENHLLMKFAGHLGLDVHALGERVRARMARGNAETVQHPKPDQPKRESIRILKEELPPAPPPEIRPLETIRPEAYASEPKRPEVRRPEIQRAEIHRPEVKRPEVNRPEVTRAEINRPEPGGPTDLKPLPPGPIQLAGPMLGAAPGDDLTPVTLQLVKQVLIFESREEAIGYVQRMCDIKSEDEATRIIDKIIRDNPDLKVGSYKIRVK